MGISRRRALREALAGYGFLAPNFIGFLVFTSLPVIASLVLAFVHWDILTQAKWAGLANFKKLLGFQRDAAYVIQGSWEYLLPWRWLNSNDPLFWKYLWNTVFLMMGIPIGMVFSLILAIIMNQKLRGIVLFRTIYFLPTISAGIALYMLWRWIYNPDFGLINSFLARFGIKGPPWLSSTVWAKPALIIMGLWTGMGGYNMILYLAGLQGINPELYEAASIDGANWWQRFHHITWPMLTPTTFFIFIMSCIGGFQGGFDAAYVMTNGGPAGATTTIMYYIYNNGFQWFKMGYAAAIAWFLFVVIFAITLINWRYGGRLVHYY